MHVPVALKHFAWIVREFSGQEIAKLWVADLELPRGRPPMIRQIVAAAVVYTEIDLRSEMLGWRRRVRPNRALRAG
jgi:hypothetical protein